MISRILTMMNKFIFQIFLIVFCVGSVFAQTRPTAAGSPKDISGTIWATSEADSIGTTLSGANVRLLQAADSALVKGLSVTNDGKFTFSAIQPGNYIIAVSFLGYTTACIDISAERFRGNRMIDLGKIVLRESALTLAVFIDAQAPELVVKEDTLEYNVAAFKVQEGAVVEDLLKRLPGVEVDTEGKITDATGKEVKRVFVNGKEFFGNDPKMATKNLTVDIVDKVQVVEKPTDRAILTGVDDGETETIINLVIKKNMMKGWMGNVTGGVGTLLNDMTIDGLRYNAQGNLLKFTETSQMAYTVNANNINNRRFSDRGNSVSMNAGRGVGISSGDIGGGGGGNFGGGGITNSNSLGVNISTFVNEKFKIGGDVRYNYSENYAIRNSFRTNLLLDSVSYRKASSDDQSFSHNLAFNAKMEYKPDSLHTVVFSPQVSINASNSYDKSFQSTHAGDIDSTMVNRSTSSSGLRSNGLEMSGELTITRLFERKGRRLGINLTGNLNHSSGSGANESFSEFFKQSGINRKLNQESETSTNSGSFSVRASFVEPISENMTLSMFYNFRRNETKNIRETFDFNEIDGNYSLLNPDFSKSLENNFINQTIGVSLNAVNRKYNYNIGINVVPSSTQSTSFIKNGISEGVDSTLNRIKGRKVVNYAPQVNFTYRFTPQTNLRFTYRGNTRQPSVSQLDPTPNNTNPLNIRSGNPNLLPSFTNTMSLRFNTNQRETQRSFTTSVDYSFTLNEIINFTEYESETGIQYTGPVNENGSWNTAGNVMYLTPIGSSKRFKFSTNTRVSYDNRIGFSTVKKQSYRNVSGTVGVTENISMSYNKEWFYGQLRANARYSNTANSLEGKQDQRNTRFGITYNTQLTLPWTIGINSDINYTAQRGLTTGYNKDEVLWNIGISKQFLKGNAATLRLDWTDILQQRLSISRNVTANYIEDSEFNALTSYVMLSFTYRFNNTTRINRERFRDEMRDRYQREGQSRPDSNWRDGGGMQGGGRAR